MYYSVLQMDRSTIKLPEPAYEHHNERRKELGLTWEEYMDNRTNEYHDRMLEATERQADALEAIAGMLMVWFDFDHENVSYSTEALYDEAKFQGTRGEE